MPAKVLPDAAPGLLPAVPPGVRLTTLENGLTIIVREDHSAPVVSAQAWCMAGSIHEGRWLGAGLSHVLEHMLFKGTSRRAGSRIDQEVQEAGGYMNAYTSFDRTVFHIDVPSTGAAVALDILCDIMQHATLPPDELAKEMEVIRREMDMNVDDPDRRAGRRLFETAYTRSPYRFTVIGYPDIFNELKPEDIRAYYHEKYAPNNVFYVVAGDVAASTVIQQIQEAYAGARARPIAPFVLPEEPPQTAPREVIEEAPIELAYLHLAWHTPELRHPDVPVLDVLATLLGSGRSSRLYRQVRETEGLVYSVHAWTYNPGNPGLLGISATLDPANLDAASAALLAEVERMQTAPVEARELEKAVKQFIAGTLAIRKTMQGQAQDLGANWLAANDLGFSDRYLAAVQRVTPADLQRVARHYLSPDSKTLYALVPEGRAPKRAAHIESLSQNPVHKLELPNGLRLLVKEDHRLPFVEFRAVCRGGVLSENPARNGVTQLMAKMLVKGTARRSAEEIAGTIESAGGSIETYAGNNSFGLNAEVLSPDFDIALDLVADVLRNPSFPPEPLEREREAQLAAIRAQKDHLLQSAFRLMRRELFGPCAYGLDPLGTEETVQVLQAGHLRETHGRLAVPDNCVLAIFGDVQLPAVETAVRKVLGDWKRGGGVVQADSGRAAAEERTTAGSMRRVRELRDKKQAVLVVGYPGTTLRSPDRYALDILQEACSDLGSRLFLRIREQLGLAYYVGAQNFSGLAPGFFAFYAGTAPEKADLVEDELLREVDSLCTEGLTEEELKRIKAKILGQKKISRQDLGGLAMTSALDELYGLGYDHGDHEDALYEAVTLARVKEVAARHFRPERAVIATILPEPGLTEAGDPAGGEAAR